MATKTKEETLATLGKRKKQVSVLTAEKLKDLVRKMNEMEIGHDDVVNLFYLNEQFNLVYYG